MRTTLEIDDPVLAAARSIAAERGISLGSALTELARRGPRSPVVGVDDDLSFFLVADYAPPITAEVVRAAFDESYRPCST